MRLTGRWAVWEYESRTLSEDTEAEVVLQDGTWVWCQLIGQRKDRHGRW